MTPQYKNCSRNNILVMQSFTNYEIAKTFTKKRYHVKTITPYYNTMSSSILSNSNNCPRQYKDKEKQCETNFTEGGPYWHLCTPGDRMSDIFATEEDFKFGMNNLAYCSMNRGFSILAFSLMSNHIHIIAEGQYSELELFFKKYRARLSLYLSKHYYVCDLDNFKPQIIPINDLAYLRNSIAYVNRNAFVVDSNQTPFSYKWSSGMFFWGGIDLNELNNMPRKKYTLREIRSLFMSGDIKLPDTYLMANDYVHPISMCSVNRSLSFFRDAHHYFGLINYRNIESFKEIANQIGEQIFVSDYELNTIIYLTCKRDYQVPNPTLLSPQIKVEVARMMRTSYNATNKQIQRILKLDEKTVNSLFPLTAKKK